MIPSTHIKAGCDDVGLIPVLRRWRKVDPCGSLASQSSHDSEPHGQGETRPTEGEEVEKV